MESASPTDRGLLFRHTCGALIFPFILNVLFFHAHVFAAVIPTVKILIEDKKNELLLEGTDMKVASFEQVEGAATLAKKKVRLQCNRLSGKISVSVDNYISNELLGPIKVTSLAGFIKVANAQYRDQLWIYSFNGQCFVINQLDLEKYVAGLLNSEMNSSWNLATLKAQAVAARTYAVYQMQHASGSLQYRDVKPPFDLNSTEADQVYEGAHQERYRTIQAVLQTKGEILSFAGKPIKAFYHSTCGGHTSSALNVWGRDYPSMKPVKCGYCNNSPRYQWLYSATHPILEKLFQAQGWIKGKLLSLKVDKKDFFGRAQKLALYSFNNRTTISGSQLRGLLGTNNIKSTAFEVIDVGNETVFRGWGSGHGVGMCQWGARTMGEMGKTYRQILSHYYPEAGLSKVY